MFDRGQFNGLPFNVTPYIDPDTLIAYVDGYSPITPSISISSQIVLAVENISETTLNYINPSIINFAINEASYFNSLVTDSSTIITNYSDDSYITLGLNEESNFGTTVTGVS